MKKFVLLISLFVLSCLALAHEFWLLPKKWRVEPGQPVQLQLRVGENFSGEPWAAATSRVTSLRSLLGKNLTEHLPALQKQGIDSLFLTFDRPGTHLVTLATNSKFIELEAQKFEDYLKEDGLEHVRQIRRQTGQSEHPGREFYRRDAATLIQVGSTPTAVFFKKTGFDLQILPQQNPLLVAPGSHLTFQVRFRGKPLSGALVRHWHRTASGAVNLVFQTSDRKGKVRFQVPEGEQMVSLVHMTPHPNPAEADWQSTWGSLSWMR